MESVNSIISILETMVDAHKKVLDVAKAKKNILISGEVQELQTSLTRESTLVEEIQQLEQQRMQYVQIYLTEKGVQGNSFTLEELIGFETDPGARDRLQSQAKVLRGLIQEISTLNETNKKLIETSLSYVQYSIGMLVQKEPAIGYGPKGGRNRYSSLLDAKI